MNYLRLRSYFVLLLVLFTIFTVSFSGCKQQEEKEAKVVKSEKEPEVIKIGAILPLTGPIGYLGEEEKKAIELAANEINIKLKRKSIKVIFEDSKGKSAESVTVANKLVNIDKVSAIIAATSSVSRAVLPIAVNNKKLFVALCMDPTIQKESPYAFRLYESMGQEANELIKYYDKTGIDKTVGILYINHPGTVQQINDYFNPGFKQIGIDIVYSEPYEIMEKDFKTKIDKLRHSNVNSLIIIGFGFEYFPIFKELVQQNLMRLLGFEIRELFFWAEMG